MATYMEATDSIHVKSARLQPSPFKADIEVRQFEHGNQGRIAIRGTVKALVRYHGTCYPATGFFGTCTQFLSDDIRFVPTVRLHGKDFVLHYRKEQGQPDDDYQLVLQVTLPSTVDLTRTCSCCGCCQPQPLQQWADDHSSDKGI